MLDDSKEMFSDLTGRVHICTQSVITCTKPEQIHARQNTNKKRIKAQSSASNQVAWFNLIVFWRDNIYYHQWNDTGCTYHNPG